MNPILLSGARLFSEASVDPPPRAPKGWVAASLGAALMVLVALWPMVPDALPNGDAAVYNQQVEQGDLRSRPTHRGYFGLMWVLTLGGREVSDLAFNRLHLMFGAASIFLLASMAAFFTGRAALALATVPIALGHLTWVQNALWAEVYGPQTFFLLATLWLSWIGRSLPAALCLSLAVLITPSSLLAVPAVLLACPTRRHLLMLGGLGGSLTLVALLPVWQDYLWGDRGLLKAGSSDLSLTRTLLKEGFEGGFGLLAFAPLLVALPWALARRRELRRPALILGVLWLVNFLLGERFQDVPVQLALWSLTLPAAVVGLDELTFRLGTSSARVRGPAAMAAMAICIAWLPILQRARTLVGRLADAPSDMVLPVAAAGVLALIALTVPLRQDEGRGRVRAWLLLAAGVMINWPWVAAVVKAENLEMTTMKSQALAIADQSSEPYAVVGGWSRGILFEHYVFARSYVGPWINSVELAASEASHKRADAESRLTSIIDAGGDVWLLVDNVGVEERLRRRGYRFGPELAAGARGAFKEPSPAVQNGLGNADDEGAEGARPEERNSGVGRIPRD